MNELEDSSDEEAVGHLHHNSRNEARNDFTKQASKTKSKEKQPEQQESSPIDEGESAIAEGKVVKKSRSAFVFYQTDQLSKIRAELGAGASMGESMTVVSEINSHYLFAHTFFMFLIV